MKNFVRSSKILEDLHEDLLRSYCGSSARSPRIFAKILKDLFLAKIFKDPQTSCQDPQGSSWILEDLKKILPRSSRFLKDP